MASHIDPDTSDFQSAPVYSPDMLGQVVAKRGFHAFQELALPSALACGGIRVPCIKHFTGFLTLWQGPGQPYLYLSELECWPRAILSIHDYRHEYLASSAENAMIIKKTSDELHLILSQWIGAMPRLRHRITVSQTLRNGLASIESHKITGEPDIEALTMFAQAYLAADRLTSDIASALERATTRETPAAAAGPAALRPSAILPRPREAGWRSHLAVFSR